MALSITNGPRARQMSESEASSLNIAAKLKITVNTRVTVLGITSNIFEFITLISLVRRFIISPECILPMLAASRVRTASNSFLCKLFLYRARTRMSSTVYAACNAS